MIPSMRPTDARERRLIQLLSGTASRREAAADEVGALSNEVDVPTLVALLKRLNMLVLVGGRLLAMGVGGMAELERQLESHGARARDWGVITEFTALDVLDRLQAAGIRALPLKGSILARRLYRDVAARSSVDIDILVAPNDLAAAVTAVEELGWRRAPGVSSAGGLPLLHETLVHPTLPRVELHWRVHWYERNFATDALARAGTPRANAPLEMQPLDGLVALMLFYARDGFTGLRYPADAAAWWDLRCAGAGGPSPAELVTQRYPSLAAPVSVASGLLAKLVGIPTEQRRGVPFRWHVATGLASPFLQAGRVQAQANAGLTDLLLAPESAVGDAMRRVMRNAPVDASRRVADAPAPWGATLGHVLRVARRWALAFVPAVVRGYALGRPIRR
jgi:putative nucleotidyltransferase-like protein